MAITPEITTELGAVNTMLSTVGMSPINSLTGTLTADVSMAYNTLAEVVRGIQVKGWHWNTDYDYPFSADLSTGFITLPATVARADMEPGNNTGGYDIVLRGQRVYDRANRTYVFEGTLKFTIVSLLPFDEMPEPARRYCEIRAARLFVDRFSGDETLHKYTERDEVIAYASLISSEAEDADHSIFDSVDLIEVKNRRVDDFAI